MRRISAVGAVVLTVALPGLVAGPSEAQHAESSCSWQAMAMPPVEKVGEVHVSAASGTGNYSGRVLEVDPDGRAIVDMVLWNRDGSSGRVHPAPVGFKGTAPVDENRSGTILLDAERLDGTGSQEFTYSGGHEGKGVYRALPTPEGFRYVRAEAINNRGDVLGDGSRIDGDGAPVVWPGDGGPPVVITLPPDNRLAQAVDIDDDGTVLLYLSKGPHVWRNGQLTKLAQPEGYTFEWADSIRNGLVAGHARTNDGLYTYQGFLWLTPSRVVPIKNSSIARGINKNGLIIGETTGSWTEGVWLGTHLVSELPDAYALRLIADDNSILGESALGNNTVWRWRCG